jgi:hypothetical protein
VLQFNMRPLRLQPSALFYGVIPEAFSNMRYLDSHLTVGAQQR